MPISSSRYVPVIALAIGGSSLAAFLAAFVACSGETTPGATPAAPTTLPDGAPLPGVGVDGSTPTTPGPDGSLPPVDIDGGGTVPGPGVSGCKPLVRAASVTVLGSPTDRYSWYDAACKLRTAALVRGDAAGGGGFARALTYDVGGRVRTAGGTSSDRWPGFGFVVSHYSTTASSSSGARAAQREVLVGAHHAIHEFKFRISPGGPVDVTVHWFFATGRSHPLYAITYDATPAGPDAVKADSRSPYGDLTWDEGPGGDGNVDGAAWGDKYKLVTTGNGPLNMSTGWDYTKPNVVPHAMLWANRADAEMGLVQTQTFTQLPAGGDYGAGDEGPGVLELGCWTRTSANPGPNCTTGSGMPQAWVWPFQLNQYEFPATTSKRVAWGQSYGSVGQTSFHQFNAKRNGYPFSSYSVAIVLGTHTGKSVEREVTSVETSQATRMTASRGTVATSGPAGVGRTGTATFAPPGYNHVYGTWDLIAAGNAVTAQLAVSAGSLENPILRLRDYGAATPPATVRVGGKVLAANDGYFATVDAVSKVLWVTLNQTISGTTTVQIE